jgi:hypothetical protein
MGAQPKNKITNVEQGKRRAGNTPKLVKDAHYSRVPLHKRGFFDKFTSWIGGTGPVAKTAAEKAADKAEKNASSSTQMKAARTTGSRAGGSSHPMAKKTTRTQHKGA